MKLLCCVVMYIVVFVTCEDEEEVKMLQKRGVYNSKITMPDNDDDEEQTYPNDFSIGRGPDSDFPHHHHYHQHGHNHDYHDGVPNFYHKHNREQGNSGDVEEELDYNTWNATGLPLDFAKSVNDYIVSDLLLNYIDDVPRDQPSFSSRFGGADSDNETERNLAERARPAKCMPELTTVKIAESKDPNVFYVPECTRIERCGGCCSHILLSCQPIDPETITVTVMKTEYTGGKKLKYIGKEPILVEKHTKCKCGCKVKAEHCNVYQEYRESECRCVCKNIDEEKKCYKNGSKKLWNPDVCSCQCREVSPCSTNYQFDYNECRCVQSQVKRRYVLSESRKELAEPAPKETVD